RPCTCQPTGRSSARGERPRLRGAAAKPFEQLRAMFAEHPNSDGTSWRNRTKRRHDHPVAQEIDRVTGALAGLHSRNVIGLARQRLIDGTVLEAVDLEP